MQVRPQRPSIQCTNTTHEFAYFFVFICFFSVGSFSSVVSTSANDWLEKHVSEITYNVSMSVVKPYMLTYSACA